MEQIVADNKALFRENRSYSFTMQIDERVAVDADVPAVTPVGVSPLVMTSILLAMFAILLAVSVAIIVMDDATGHSSYLLSKLDEQFNFDIEVNVPSYFNTLLLVCPSMLLGMIAYLKFKRRETYVMYWAVLAVGFFIMSFDELCSIHERLIKPLRRMMGGEHFGFFYFAWTIPAIVLVMVLGGIFLRFWWNLPRKTRFFFAVSAAVYLGGAVVMEMLDGRYADIYGQENLTYKLLVTFEETLEMVGLIIFIKALLDYMADAFPKIELRFGNSEST